MLLIIAGAANGLMDTLQFHYPKTGFSEKSSFWNPNISWENKWSKNDDGSLIVPLTPRYFGAATFLSFTTDAWHLSKFIHTNAIRLALLIALGAYLKPRWGILGPSFAWVAWVVIWGAVMAVQSAGFHLVYTLIY